MASDDALVVDQCRSDHIVAGTLVVADDRGPVVRVLDLHLLADVEVLVLLVAATDVGVVARGRREDLDVAARARSAEPECSQDRISLRGSSRAVGAVSYEIARALSPSTALESWAAPATCAVNAFAPERGWPHPRRRPSPSPAPDRHHRASRSHSRAGRRSVRSFPLETAALRTSGFFT